MALKVDLLLWFLFLYLSQNWNLAIARELSREEDLELEEELRRLTKPAVETIETTYGDTYDCVDFYKQPAFDNPLLKNHSYKYEIVKKSTLKFNPIQRKHTNLNFSSNFIPKLIWKNGKGCPVGTVPIRRITKDDLIRAKSAAKLYDSHFNPQTAEEHGTHYAIVHTPRSYPRQNYYGAGMFAGEYNPPIQLGTNSYSSSQIKVQNGGDRIIVGWTVNPQHYKDSRTRFFIYTNTGTKSCFNTLCGLFILTRSDFPIDLAFNVSKPGGPIYAEHFHIYKDVVVWKLQIAFESEYSAEIGFWPEKIFTGLKNAADYIEWGGQVFASPGLESPQMGFGEIPLHPEFDAAYHGFCARIQIVNEKSTAEEIEGLEKYRDLSPLFYRIYDEGFRNQYLGHTIWYGGDGGYKGNL